MTVTAALLAASIAMPANVSEKSAESEEPSKKEVLVVEQDKDGYSEEVKEPEEASAATEEENEAVEENVVEEEVVEEDAVEEPVEEVVEDPVPDILYSSDDLRYAGVIYDGNVTYTWYSESELPGGGLDIPGRHHELGFVMDGDGNVCVASCDYSRGTPINVPFGYGRAIVYDYCPTSGIIDVYLP